MTGPGALRRRLFVQGLALALPFAARAVQPSTNAPGVKIMSTQAAGRYLIDLPEGFAPLAGNRVELFFGLDRDARRLVATLLANRGSAAELSHRVAKRTAALAAERHETLSRPMLIREQASAGGRVHLVRSYEDGQLEHVLRSEVFCRVGDALLHLEAESYRVAPEDAESRLLAVANKATAAGPAGASGAGFSLGAVVVVADHHQEIATLNYRHPGAADLLFTLSINALTPNPVPGLLARWDKNSVAFLKGLAGAPVTIRRGAVAFGTMSGEELLTRGKIDGRALYKFNAESRRDRPAFAAPLLSLTLDTEPVGPAELWPAPAWTEAQAVAVWDQVMRSIRLRPGAV